MNLPSYVRQVPLTGSGPAPQSRSSRLAGLARYLLTTEPLRLRAGQACPRPWTLLRIGSTVNYAKSQLVPLSSPWVRVVREEENYSASPSRIPSPNPFVPPSHHLSLSHARPSELIRSQARVGICQRP